MKATTIKALFALLAAACSSAAAAAISVDCAYPGGNVKVVAIDEAKGVLDVAPDLRDTQGRWFNFYFTVKGAAGRTLQFRFPQNGYEYLSSLGPAISKDGGASWAWLRPDGTRHEPANAFAYTFGPGEDSTRFSMAIPYLQKDWDAFAAKWRDKGLKLDVLCKSQSGRRDTELARIPCRWYAKSATWLFVLTARHHACEASANPPMEGAIEEALSGSAEGEWLRDNADCVFVPFMDKDGVEDGDQGKNRRPYDHNRDYLKGRYTSVRAIKELMVKESVGKRIVYIDLHSPHVRSLPNCPEQDQAFSFGSSDARLNANWNVFRKKWAEAQKGGALVYDGKFDIQAGTGHSAVVEKEGKKGLLSSRHWVETLTNCHMSTCCEFGYSLCGGVYSPAAARELGRNMMKAAVRMAREAGEPEPAVVSFKDASKIRSWDAWNDHKKPQPKKERRCVTWERIRQLESGLPPAGELETRHAKDIRASAWSIGCETMDRDYADWDQFKSYVGMLGAKRGRLFSGWAKTEQEKGKYDFAWLDPQVREMAAMGVKPWICLSYGNPVWGSDFRLGMRVKQVTGRPESFAAWLRYCRACVARYKDVVDEWEIWNEPFSQAEEYAEMVYRTAKAIREEQPAAKCFVTAIHMPDYKVVLERLKAENALDLVTRWIYHPYDVNPDSTYAKHAEPLRRLVKSYSPSYDILQGEVGCPAQLEFAHALANIEWTEYSQAKWNLRRTMGDAARNIPCNVFTMIDLQYTFMLQSFGQLRSNLLKEVVYRRPSFYAMQHVFSFFDEDVRPVSVAKQTVNAKELTVAKFERKGTPVYVMWFSGKRPSDTLAYERGTVEMKAFGIEDPVWADLLTGRICTFPKANVATDGDTASVRNVPLWDSPVMLLENSQAPRRAGK